MSWQQKLQRQIKGIEVGNVKHLRFTSLNLPKVPVEFAAEIEKYQNLESLSLNSCKIRTIEALPQLKSLKCLEMLDNFVTGNTLKHIVTKFPNLENLQLGGNHLKELNELDCLSKLEMLQELNIMNGMNKPESQIRQYCFNTIPKLVLLDERDQYGNLPVATPEIKETVDEEAPKAEMQQQIEEEIQSSESDDEDNLLDSSDGDSGEDDEEESGSDLEGFIVKKVKTG